MTQSNLVTAGVIAGVIIATYIAIVCVILCLIFGSSTGDDSPSTSFCGWYVFNHVGYWYCPVTLA